MIVKHAWRSEAVWLREQLTRVREEADGQPAEFRQAWLAGTYRALLGNAVMLAEQLIEAADRQEKDR